MLRPMEPALSPAPDTRPTRDAGPSLRIIAGARATEQALLDEVARQVGAARRDPSLLATPVRVVVPSRTLREHVARRLVERFGGAVLGVAVQTLHGLARDVLERSGARVALADDLAPVLVRREARAEPALSHVLDLLEDGYGSVVGVVSDVLNAGFLAPHAEAIEDLLLEEAPPESDPLEIVRARALVRVAARVASGLRRHGLGHGSVRFAEAGALLEGDVDASLLPARAILVHGFADATGVALGLLRALARRAPFTLFVDDPPDPGAAPGAATQPGRLVQRFPEPFVAALETVARPVRVGVASPPPPTLACLEAPGPDAEARAVAERVADLLGGGARPEGIAIVARTLAPFALPLRRHLRRLGVPFSSPAAVSWGERARRAAALNELLRRGGDASPERWLEASALAPRLRADLRLAFHHLGFARLRDVAAFSASGGALTLPGVVAFDGDEDDDEVRRWRRTLPRAELEAATARARSFVEAEAALAAPARLDAHAARLAAALRGALLPRRAAATAAASVVAELLREIEELPRELPAAFELDGPELVALIESRLRAAAEEPLGGAGAGVAVLDATAARGLVFDHLFLIGVERDVFPRAVADDPLLSDGLRRVVRAKLDDLPVKSLGFDEERHLFAQLLSAAPAVTLSWSSVGDDGKPRSLSPLVERLRLARGLPEAEAVPGPFAPPDPERGARGRTACEHAQLAAIGDARRLAALLPLALAEGVADAASADALAGARLAVLAAHEPPRSEAPTLTPYLGLVGAVSGTDPRRSPPAITALESIARCGWRAFLERVLFLEPLPDALGALPGLDDRLAGIVVHEALDAVARPHDGHGAGIDAAARPGERRNTTLEAAACAMPTPVAWPDDDELDALLVATAARVLEREEIPFPALARPLAERARAAVRLARDDDRERGARVAGVEVTGELEVPETVAPRDEAGRALSIRFRADRVERDGDALVLVDFKTGKPLSTAKTPKKRDEHLAKATAGGIALQASAYAASAAALCGRPALGRYLYLRPGDELERVALDVRSDDTALAEAFSASLRTVLAARATGALFPRVVDAQGREPAACRHCAVAEACVRGDSGARARLQRFFEPERGAPAAGSEPEAFGPARALWSLRREGDG